MKFTVGGQEGRFDFELDAPETDEDGVRLCRVDVSINSLEGSLTLPRFRDEDLDRFRDSVAELLDAPDLTGEARIGSDHGAVQLRIELTSGRGRAVIRVRSEFAMQDGEALLTLSTDQTFVGALLKDLRRIPGASP